MHQSSLVFYLLSIVFCFSPPPTFANSSTSRLDSLTSELSQEKTKATVDQLLLIVEENTSVDSALYYAQKALKWSQELEYTEVIAKAYYLLGSVYKSRKDSDLAVAALSEAMDRAEKSADKVLSIKAGTMKGYALNNMGLTQEAQQTFLQSLTLANQVPDQSYKADVYFSIAEFHRLQHDVPKAIENYEKAKEIYREIGEIQRSCRVDYGKAIAYKVSPDSILVRRGIFILDSLIDNSACYDPTIPKRPLALAHTALGSMYTYFNEFEPAIYHLHMGLEYKIAYAADSASLAYSFNELATLYHNQKNYAKAIEFGNKAYAYLGNKKDIFVSSDILRMLSQSYQGLGVYQLAHQYLKKAYDLKDSIVNLQKASALVEMEAKYETVQKEERIAQQNLEIALQKNHFNRLVLIGLLLISCICGLSLWYYFRLQNKTLEANKSQELEQLKNRFLTNISHEFRTPLSLIIGPLQKLKSSATDQSQENITDSIPVSITDIQLMTRNAERLQQLINQLLNLSKLGVKQLKLNTAATNLTNLIQATVENFISLADQKEIELQFEAPEKPIIGLFDREKINIILTNLLSNAFKFTNPNGQIGIALSCEKDQVNIIVSDTGEGIDSRHLPHIFKRFYQVDDSNTRAHEGSGIGLALTQELVKIHGGDIAVESKPGVGSRFIVSIPFKNALEVSTLQKKEILIFRKTPSLETASIAKSTVNEATLKNPSDHKVLVVEDNKDLRLFIKQYLMEHYEVLEAEDGRTGLKLAQEHLPDLIISDVMMPGSGNDGLTLCKALKEATLTSHIPIILLTAKTSREDTLAGFEHQIDAYIPKPFDPQILLTRIQNLIQQRKTLRVLFAESIQVIPEELVVSSRDQVFVRQIMEVIENHLADENFGINELGQAVNMDRTQLYRKIKALTNQTPNNFLRNIRLQRAKHLLEQQVGNVSEIAQMVGYGNRTYFSQIFKKEFGETPQDVLKKTVES